MRIRAEDKPRLQQKQLDAVEMVYLSGPLARYELAKSTEDLLRFVPVGMYGPPEKCYYTQTSDTPALLYNHSGGGAVAAFPLQIGAHYRHLCHPVHALLVAGALDGLLERSRHLKIDASPLVEIAHRVNKKGRFELVSLLNHTGQSGNAIFAPIPMRDITMSIRARQPVTTVRLLRAGRTITFRTDNDGWTRCTLPILNHFEVVVFETQPH